MQLTVVALAAVIGWASLCDGTDSKDGPQNVQYDKAKFARRLNVTIDFCKSTTNERCAQRWIIRYDRIADYQANILLRYNYAHSNRIDPKLGNELVELTDKVQQWNLRHLKIARRFQWKGFTGFSLRRRFEFLTRSYALEDDAERLELSHLSQSLTESYSRLASCPNGPTSCLQMGEQAVQDVLASPTAGYDYKQAVWHSWYNAASAALSANFTRYAQLVNKAARAAGRRDAGEADWLPDFESPTFNSDVLAWQAQLAGLYQQLHAYVRHRLSLRHPGRFDPAGCLPMHILGHDQWAQQWQLPMEDYPYPDRAKFTANHTALLANRFTNFTQMVRAAEEFFTSLGMPAMTRQFWRRSDFFKPAEPTALKDCHASAWEFAKPRDFRIRMCGKVSREDFYVIHHEMGHIEYYMAYSRQPRGFRNSANSGFHEAVGDTISLSVDTKAHYAKLGLVSDASETKEDELNSMFAVALEKVSFLPFALSTGVFRWLVFNDTATPESYNRVWWRLRSEHGGVCPPVDRPETGFDAGAKYHVALDISYIRYYFSFILQFQLHRRMCQLSGHKGPINRCDFYQSKAAGEKLWKMLQEGCSRPWQDILKDFTGQDGLQTSALLEYFKPLHDWLADYNRKNNVPVGWKLPDNVLKGVSH